MNKRTFAIRQAELLRDVNKHPHRTELLNIMSQQIADDTVTVNTDTNVQKIKRLTIKVNDELHVKLKILAAARGETLDSLMNDAAELYIQRNSKDITDVFNN